MRYQIYVEFFGDISFEVHLVQKCVFQNYAYLLYVPTLNKLGMWEHFVHIMRLFYHFGGYSKFRCISKQETNTKYRISQKKKKNWLIHWLYQL